MTKPKIAVTALLLLAGFAFGQSRRPSPPVAMVVTAGNWLQLIFNTNTLVVWSLDTPSVGTLSPTGVYTAPASVDAPVVATARGTSAVDPTKQVVYVIRVIPKVSISPLTANVPAGGTLQFSANLPVAWALLPVVGSIDAQGFYRAPAEVATSQTVSVAATSVEDPSNTAFAELVIQTGAPFPPPVPSAVSDVTVEAISHSSAKFRFITASPGPGTLARVDYGSTPELEFQSRAGGEGNDGATTRSRSIAGLRPATRYYFRPVVSDNSGAVDTFWTCPSAGSSSGYICDQAGGLPYFTTAEAPPMIPVAPSLPEQVDTSMPVINGQTFVVSLDDQNRCVDFPEQLAAAAAANPSLNHQVIIPAGSTCYGQHVLPQKTGPGTVVIRPSTPDNLLPPPGTRIDPSYRSLMARISVPRVPRFMGQALRPALSTPEGCASVCTEGWRLVGIEITHPRHDEIQPTVLNVVSISDGVLTLDGPHRLNHFNQVYVAEVQGMTGVNGTWPVSIASDDSFRLVGTQISGEYGGGGYIVHALSSQIVDCTNTSPVVCTTATRHGLSNAHSVDIESIDGPELTLPADHLRLHQAIEISGSSLASHNGLWYIDRISSNRVTLGNGPTGTCSANCGTVTWRRTIQVAEVRGNTAANGSHAFRVESDSEIALLDASGNGGYAGGGFVAQDPDMYFSLLLLRSGSARMVLDRCYFHGQGFPTRIYFAFQLDSSDSAVIDSYLEDVHAWGPVNPLSRAIEPGGVGASIIAIGNGHRLKLSNNAFVNSPGIPLFTQEFRDGEEMAPTDVEISRNLFYNSERFRAGSQASDGRHYNTSHILEFKKGKRVLIDGNIFDGNWADRTPTGPTIAFSPRGAFNFTNNVISDITVTNNVFRRISHAIYVIGSEGRKELSTDPTARFRISNNLFAQIDYWRMHSEPSLFAGPDLSSGAGTGGATLWIFGSVEDLEFTHNTTLDQRGPNPKFVSYNFGHSSGVLIRHNIFPHNQDLGEGGLSEAWEFDWATPPISGTPSAVFQQYFLHAPDPDPNSIFSDNLVIPGVRNTFDSDNFDNPSDSANFTTTDCEQFYSGFNNITCAGTGQPGETANQRFSTVFGSPAGFVPITALPGSPGIAVEPLEDALGMTIEQAFDAGEALDPTTIQLSALRPRAGRLSDAQPKRTDAKAQVSVRPEPTKCSGLPCPTLEPSPLQMSLDGAKCGDSIVLQAGETVKVSGPVSLPAIDCPPDRPLIITTSEWLFPVGSRVTPVESWRMARIEAEGFPGTIFTTTPGVPTRGVVFRGLELAASDVPQSGPLVRLEGAADIVLDQLYVHGRTELPSGPALLLSGAGITVKDSFFEGFWAPPAGPSVSTLIVAGPDSTVSFTNNHVGAESSALAVFEGTTVDFRFNTIYRPVEQDPCSTEWDGIYRSVTDPVLIEGGWKGIFEDNQLEGAWDRRSETETGRSPLCQTAPLENPTNIDPGKRARRTTRN